MKIQRKLSRILAVAFLLSLLSCGSILAEGRYGSLQSKSVEDLDFLSLVETTEVENKDGQLCFAKDIHLPFFTLEGEGAEEANEDISYLLERIVKSFDDPDEDYQDYYKDVDYWVYEDDQLLSVCLSYKGGESSSYRNHDVYNIDLETGQLLSCEELLELLGLEPEEFLNIVEYNLIESAKQRYERNLFFSESYEITSNLSYFWISYKVYDELDFTLYVDPTGALRLLDGSYFDPDMPELKYGLPLTLYELGDDLISPQYRSLAALLDIDPEDKEIKALVLNLGALDIQDEENPGLQQLKAVYRAIPDPDGPKVLYLSDYSSEENKTVFYTDEAYLVVPRHPHTMMALSKASKEYEDSYYDVSGDYGLGATLLFLSEAEVDDPLYIRYQLRDDKVIFRPEVKGSELKLPEGFIDISEQVSDLLEPPKYYDLPSLKPLLEELEDLED